MYLVLQLRPDGIHYASLAWKNKQLLSIYLKDRDPNWIHKNSQSAMTVSKS